MRYAIWVATAVAFALGGCEEDPADEPRYALDNDDIADVTPEDVPTVAWDWPDLSHFDIDANGRLDRSELERAVSSPEWMGEWDADDDGALTEDEYYSGLFDAWRGEDDVIARDEYRAAVGAWFPDVDWEFMAFDGNADGFVDEVEFSQTMRRTDTFASMDGDDDGRLGQAELATGAMQRWDEDGDGVLARDEWDLG